MVNAVFGWKALLVNLPRSAALCRGILGSWVMSTGNGPLDELDFDEFLSACNVYIVCPFHSTREDDVLVIGHDDWNKDFLDYIIETHAGGILRVYSQEMVIASLALGADIFKVLSAEELRTFGNGHPALEYLMTDMGFDWPTTDVVISFNNLVVDFGKGPEWPEIGVLKQMGYKVGNKGIAESVRQEILSRLFLKVNLLPPDPNSSAQIKSIEEWGNPKNSLRLQKMANCLANFTKLKKKRKRGDFKKAIKEWETDLAWLKQNYYESKFGFGWPDTCVK